MPSGQVSPRVARRCVVDLPREEGKRFRAFAEWEKLADPLTAKARRSR
jgi:hypothetical protein